MLSSQQASNSPLAPPPGYILHERRSDRIWLFHIFGLQATSLISKKELLTIDPDTDDGQLTYEVTTEPKYGYLESKLTPGKPITSFTQGIGLYLFILTFTFTEQYVVTVFTVSQLT